MLAFGESQKGAIRPDFNRSSMIDFQGATISSDTGFILLSEVDERFKIIDPMKDCLEDLRSPTHTKHALVQMVRQRVYQIGAVYEDCNDADFLRIYPALRLALGKNHRLGASKIYPLVLLFLGAGRSSSGGAILTSEEFFSSSKRILPLPSFFLLFAITLLELTNR